MSKKEVEGKKKETDWKPDSNITMIFRKSRDWKPDKNLRMKFQETIEKRKKKEI